MTSLLRERTRNRSSGAAADAAPRGRMPRRVPAAAAGLAALAAAAGGPARALDCEALSGTSATYTVCRADPARDDLHVFLRGEDGRPLRSFAALERMVEAQGKRVAFAMNGGMYHEDRAPVGLLVEQGREIAPLNLRAGVGNFFMKPNGVFLVGPGGAAVVESSKLAKARPDIRLATQSGPLLVQDGAIHRRFIPGSTSLHVRNGVGIDAAGAVVFAISREPVSFYDFATFFRDALHCPNALYLDGSVSSIDAPSLGQRVERNELGPMIVVVEGSPESE